MRRQRISPFFAMDHWPPFGEERPNVNLNALRDGCFPKKSMGRLYLLIYPPNPWGQVVTYFFHHPNLPTKNQRLTSPGLGYAIHPNCGINPMDPWGRPSTDFPLSRTSDSSKKANEAGVVCSLAPSTSVMAATTS